MEKEEHNDCSVEKSCNTSNAQQTPETPHQTKQEKTSAKISTLLLGGNPENTK